jgi:hypothetical protein
MYITQICILVTYYSALTIETVSMTNFGLTGTKLGVFLVLLNMAVLMSALYFAVMKYRVQLRDSVLREARVSKKHKRCILHKVFFFLSFFRSYESQSNNNSVHTHAGKHF